jgi:hypothetical protein
MIRRFVSDGRKPEPDMREVRDRALMDMLSHEEYRRALYDFLRERAADADALIGQGVNQESLAVMSQNYGAKSALQSVLEYFKGLEELS